MNDWRTLPSALQSLQAFMDTDRTTARRSVGKSISTAAAPSSFQSAITLPLLGPLVGRLIRDIPKLVTVSTELPGSSASVAAWREAHLDTNCGPSIKRDTTRLGATARTISPAGSGLAKS